MENNNGEEDEESSISLPIDIISLILTRLPIKSLFQFRSVSKEWLSLISSPSFHKDYHHHRSNSLLITAYDSSKYECHLLSVPRDTVAPVIHLLTFITTRSCMPEHATELEHLHGLVLLTIGNGYFDGFALVINPSTREFLKLKAPDSVSVYGYGRGYTCYFFGYDEIRNKHKVLSIKMRGAYLLSPFQPSRAEIMLFDFGSFEWRKIDVEFPTDISTEDWYNTTKQSVCVNSVIHLMLRCRNEVLACRNEVLAFDLGREIFEIIKIPNEALPIEYGSRYDCKGEEKLKFNYPFLIKVNGFLGVVCHDRVVKNNEMDIWMLKDYEKRVWDKETIVFGESWVDSEGPFPSDYINVDEIAFAPIRISSNLIRVPIYDVKTRSFESVKYFLGEHFLHAQTVKFNQIRSYDESIVPLERNAATTSSSRKGCFYHKFSSKRKTTTHALAILF